MAEGTGLANGRSSVEKSPLPPELLEADERAWAAARLTDKGVVRA